MKKSSGIASEIFNLSFIRCLNLIVGVRKRAHVVLHELAHLLEERKHRLDDNYIDESRFTHEFSRGTPFADFNLFVAQALIVHSQVTL